MEPPAAVAAAMQQADAVFLHTSASLTHSQARIAAQKAGARVISMPGVSGDTFLRTQSALVLEKLVGQVIFNKTGESAPAK